MGFGDVSKKNRQKDLPSESKQYTQFYFDIDFSPAAKNTSLGIVCLKKIYYYEHPDLLLRKNLL